MNAKVNMTAEQKTEAIEALNGVIERMTADIDQMEKSLAASILRGENTLLLTEDEISAVTIQGEKYVLRGVTQAAFFSPKGALQMVAAWNENHPEMKIKAMNWRTAYERQIASCKGYIEDYKARIAEF